MTQKQKPHRPRKRQPRSVILSFRLRRGELELLQNDLTKNPIGGVRSVKQFSRKLSVDYANGRLVYIDPMDRIMDTGPRDHMNREPLDCRIKDQVFLAALLDFIKTEENWHRLRLLLLRAGWPEDLLEEHSSAGSNAERLAVARKFIQRMLKES